MQYVRRADAAVCILQSDFLLWLQPQMCFISLCLLFGLSICCGTANKPQPKFMLLFSLALISIWRVISIVYVCVRGRHARHLSYQTCSCSTHSTARIMRTMLAKFPLCLFVYFGLHSHTGTRAHNRLHFSATHNPI